MLVLGFTRGTRAVDANRTNYDNEVAAVHLTLTVVRKRKYQNIIIFIDSQDTIKAVSSVTSSKDRHVLDCQQLIYSLIDGNHNVTQHLTPSHCGSRVLNLQILWSRLDLIFINQILVSNIQTLKKSLVLDLGVVIVRLF